jgi:hypothetical protein
MTGLEERYRKLLRLLPVSYRQAWEEDMVAAFLESMATGDAETDEYTADYGRPSRSEVASVVALAIRLRVDAPDAFPRLFVWGEAVRLATLMVALFKAVMAAGSIGLTAWLSGRVPGLTPPDSWVDATRTDFWHALWHLTGAAWLPAYLALVLGYRRSAQAVAALAVIHRVVYTATLQVAPGEWPAVTAWTICLLDLLVLLGMTAFRDNAPPVRPRRWLLAIPVGVLTVPLPVFTLAAATPPVVLLDWPGLVCVLVTVAILGYRVGRLSGRIPPTPPWPLALTLLAAITAGIRLVTLADLQHQVESAALIRTGMVELLAVLLVGLPLAVTAGQALRRLSAAPAVPTEPTR